MRILFLTHYFTPEGNAPAARTHEHCKRWIKEGHEIQVLTCVPNLPDGIVYEGYRNNLWQRETIDGIEIIRVWTFLAANKGTIRRILNYVSYMFAATIAGVLVKRPDLVIATSPQFFCGLSGAIISKIRRIPFILEIRDIWPDGITAAGGLTNAKWAIRLVEFLASCLYRSALKIITVGDGYKQKLEEKGISKDKIEIIPNGADSSKYFPCKPNKDLIEHFSLNGKFVCSYIGTIGMSHGLSIVLRAAKILREEGNDRILFMLVGDGAERLDLEKFASDTKLNNIIFTGRQPKELVPQLLSVADVCLVHLRKMELFKTVYPSKIFEAAAMAKPIILGVEGFASKLIREAGAGICIEPENEVELLEALGKLKKNSNLRRAYGASGRKYVNKHFNRDKLAAEYLRLIVDLHTGAD